MRPSPARHPVLRRPTARTIVVGILAVVLGVVVTRTVARAEAAAVALGPTVDVYVAQRSLDPGDVVSPDDVVSSPRPVAHLPSGAWRRDGDPLIGAVVRAPISGGEIVVDDRVGSADDPIPVGFRAVAVPRMDVTLPVRVGDLVDLVSADIDTGARPTIVARAATVHAVTDDSVVVIVADDALATVVGALTAGVVVLALA